jgi:DNA polymerase-3 subunit beta
VEQLNIEGKRSGQGFVAHKAMLVYALSRALAERITLLDFTIGRKGFLGYLKALGGSNIVKVTPSTDGASGSQAVGKRLKVICGANASYIGENEWIGEKTPLTLAEVRVSPSNAVRPNVGASELAEALNRVLPFTAKDDNRPILQCVNFVAKEGKLTLVSADGFRLAVIALPFEGEGEGQALISRDDLKGIANALKRAKRARVSFEGEDVTKPSSLILDTELIRYKWVSSGGQYPEWQKLIPTEFNTVAHFDMVEAIKAIASLKVLADSKAYPIDLTIGNGKLIMANPDDKGQAELPADTEGEVNVRIDGGYLAQAVRACGGMADLKLTSPMSPMLFTANGFQLVTMPMATEKVQAEAKPKAEAESKPKVVAEAEKVAEAHKPSEPKAEKRKPKHKAKEPVAVA